MATVAKKKRAEKLPAFAKAGGNSPYVGIAIAATSPAKPTANVGQRNPRYVATCKRGATYAVRLAGIGAAGRGIVSQRAGGTKYKPPESDCHIKTGRVWLLAVTVEGERVVSCVFGSKETAMNHAEALAEQSLDWKRAKVRGCRGSKTRPESEDT